MQFVTENSQIFIAAGGVLAGMIIAMILFGAFKKRTWGRRGQRLGINEFLELDQTRRLVLIRRDETEHLLIIGGAQDVVIETGIGKATQETRVPVEPIDTAAFQAALRPPRPPIFGDRIPLTTEREPPPFTTAVKEP